MDYALSLKYLYPNAAWSISGNTYDGITWLDAAPKPTDSELQAAYKNAKYAEEYNAVSVARQAAYAAPGGSDSVFFQFQRGQKTEQEWLDAVKAIDDANPYPKPSKGVTV